MRPAINPPIVVWCSACHGYGGDPFTTAMCQDCKGFGGFNIETQQPARWFAQDDVPAINPTNMTDRNWWSSPRYWAEQTFGAVVIIGGFGFIHSLIFALEGATP